MLSQLSFLLQRKQDRNVRFLLQFVLILAGMICLFSVLFHVIMLHEGKEFSWITGFYWTLTVMSTLGFGDITFTSDLGKLFSLFVLLSGIVFLLIILPFTFIQFFYAPWLEAQNRAKAPRELPSGTSGHVILANYDSITDNLVDRLQQYRYAYALVVGDMQTALELYDMNYRVVLGELGDPETYRSLRVQNAALVVANSGDMMNTNIAATVREVTPDVPIVTNAEQDDSVDILQLAGSTYVFQLKKMLGQSLARRTLGTNARANVIGSIDSLLISEVPAMRTPLEGQSLEESRLRQATGLTAIGIWERGRFEIPTAQTMVGSATVLLLAGTSQQFDDYDRHFVSYQKTETPVLILGGGRVGQAAAETLLNHDLDYRIIEKNPRLVPTGSRFVLGSAADINTLNRAGIREAASVIVTTRDDHTNIYLTIYCRRLRPDIQIISRANLERNISKLHSAGADLVMSYASIGSSTIVNLLNPNDLLMLAEGLNVFRAGVHPSLVRKTLAQSRIRQDTGCSLIAVNSAHSGMLTNPDPSYRFGDSDEMILIGTDEAQERFNRRYSSEVRAQPATR
jgi:Trk K+ transport system NAD-binding subunit